LRQRPLRAGAGCAPEWRFRDIRPGDRPRPASAPEAPGSHRQPGARRQPGIERYRPRQLAQRRALMAAGSASGIRTDRHSPGARLVAGWGRWVDGVGVALRLTLGRPALWPVALVGFLARGGIVLFLLAVVTPPSPVGLANLVGPTAVTATGLNPIVVGPLVAIVVGCV